MIARKAPNYHANYALYKYSDYKTSDSRNSDCGLNTFSRLSQNGRISQNQLDKINARISQNTNLYYQSRLSKKSVHKSINNLASKSYDSFKFLTNVAFEKENPPDLESQDAHDDYFSMKSVKVQIARCVHGRFLFLKVHL